MDAPFDHDGIDAPLNAVDIERERLFSHGTRGDDNDSHARFSSALPPGVRRVAVHGVKRTADTAVAQCYGVFLYDTAGREHALAQFEDAASAAYAALRFGQIYRVGVEFGNFSDPKALRPVHD